MTTLLQKTLLTAVSSTGNFGVRQKIGGVSAGTWTDFRVRLMGHPTLLLPINNMAIGIYDNGSVANMQPPTRIQFSGANSITIPAGGFVWSDPVAERFTIRSGDAFLVHFEIPPGSTGSMQIIPGSGDPLDANAGFAYKTGALNTWDQTEVSGWTWIPYRSNTVDRLTANYANVGGGLPLIDSFKITTPVSGVSLVNNTGTPYVETMLHVSHLGSDREISPAADSVLVAYCGFDYGASFSKTLHVSSGLVIWPNASAPWPPTNDWPLPAGNKIDPLSTVALGFLLSADSGDSAPNCTSGEAWFTSEGMMNGVATKTNYRSKMHKNGLGLINGVEIPILYDTYGTCGLNPGQIMNAIRVEASGNGPIYPLVQGVVSWYGIR